MKEWTVKQISEAYPYGFRLFNKNGKPYVRTTCNVCGREFTKESTEVDIMPIYCDRCLKKYNKGE